MTDLAPLDGVIEGPRKQLPDTLGAIAVAGLEAYVGPTVMPLVDLEIVLARAALALDKGASEDQFRTVIADAIQQARSKHADFDQYLEPMLIATLGFVPYTSRITAGELVESIYVIAKYSDFMVSARKRSYLWARERSALVQ